jgi:hypothetical protein
MKNNRPRRASALPLIKKKREGANYNHIPLITVCLFNSNYSLASTVMNNDIRDLLITCYIFTETYHVTYFIVLRIFLFDSKDFMSFKNHKKY